MEEKLIDKFGVIPLDNKCKELELNSDLVLEVAKELDYNSYDNIDDFIEQLKCSSSIMGIYDFVDGLGYDSIDEVYDNSDSLREEGYYVLNGYVVWDI